MSEAEDIAIYRSELADLARNLPVTKAVSVLRGAVILAGDHDAVEDLRDLYLSIREVDAQLELIASGQMRLQLEEGK